MNETKTEWRDCADPDELAAAVAAGVVPEWTADDWPGWRLAGGRNASQFSCSMEDGCSFRLPTSWTWSPEPPAPDDDSEPIEVVRRTRREVTDDFVEGTRTIREWIKGRGVQGPALCEELDAWLDYWGGWPVTTDPHTPEPPAPDDLAARARRHAYTHPESRHIIEELLDEVEMLRHSVDVATDAAPVPPWPGAVLSGLTDEDGVPTWLAQAGQVRGEQVRACTSVPWLPNTSYGEDEWVEVRAPRAVPAALVTVTIPAETAHALLRYIEDGDYDTDYVIDRLADLLIAAMDGDQ